MKNKNETGATDNLKEDIQLLAGEIKELYRHIKNHAPLVRPYHTVLAVDSHSNYLDLLHELYTLKIMPLLQKDKITQEDLANFLIENKLTLDNAFNQDNTEVKQISKTFGGLPLGNLSRKLENIVIAIKNLVTLCSDPKAKIEWAKTTTETKIDAIKKQVNDLKEKNVANFPDEFTL
jgi:hypothetical protein